MYDYKPNSHRSKEEQQKTEERKKIEKVVSGKVKTKKKGELRKFADDFVREDMVNIKSYILTEVLIPTIKNTIWDAFTNSLDMILFKGTGHSRKTSGGSKVSYRSFYDQRDRGRSSSDTRARRFDYDDIIFESKGEAEAVLDQMFEVIENYNVVSVADLYDMAGLSEPYTSNKFGWTNLRNAEVVRVRDGYVIKLPKALPID